MLYKIRVIIKQKGSIMKSFLVTAAIYGLVATYLVWGFVFALESLLAMGGNEGAKRWLRKWHGPRFFAALLFLFLPMIWIGYFFLEILPEILGFRETRTSFDLQKIIQEVYESGPEEKESKP